MCGNGVRAVAKLLQSDSVQTPKIHTLGGIKSVTFVDDLVRVNMGKAVFEGEKELKIDNQKLTLTCINMGNPHAVWIVDKNVASVPLEQIGPVVENDPYFPNKTNFEIVSLNADKTLATMRVWERGSGLTLACGTGACAVFAALKLEQLAIDLPGGRLNFHYNDAKEIMMTGPAQKVFEGVYLI